MQIKLKNNHLILIFILLFVLTAYADQGGSDSYGYMWTDSNDPPNIGFAWEDISNETNIFGDSINEDLSGGIPLPFPFSFYGGTPRNQVYISSNGWLSFTYPSGGATYPDNTPIPSGSGPDAMLGVYWDDLISSTGNNGGVYYKEEGTAPNRRFIVQWHMLNGTPDPDEIEFQVILYETSNLIKFQYNTIDPVFDGGVSATIGIKNNTSQGNQRSNDDSGIVSDGTAILFHNSAVTGVAANISPSSVQIGTFQTFNYTINNILGPAGLGKLDRIAIGNPLSNIPVVTGVTINGTAVGIQNSSLKPEAPGFATWEYVNYTGVDSIIVQTSYFEVINSIVITFMMGIPETTAASYQFGSSSDGILDLSEPVIKTNTSVTLTTGPLDDIVIRNDSNGAGDIVNNIALTTDNEITLYAAGYDAGDNFLGDQPTAVWTLTGTLDQPGGSGASFTFSPDTAPTSGSINATVGGYSDATGNITVNVGILHHIRINGSAGASGIEVGNTTLTAGQSLYLYASGYDADGNYRSAENVNWSSTGTLDPVNASGTNYIFTPTTAPSAGTIIADNGTYSDTTGTITVSEGTLSYIKIMPTTGGAGDEVGDVSLSADDALTLYAAGYDVNHNFLGEVAADWVSTGTLDDVTQTASSINFEPVTAPTSGTIIANVSGASGDATGLINVGVGSLDYITINDNAGSNGVEIAELNLSPGQSVNMYASGYDSDNNFISAISVTWESTGNLDPVSASGTSYTFTPITAPTSGTITITDGTHPDATGTIIVGSGAFTNIKILDLPGGAGTEIGDVSMTTDESLTLYAASYDDYDNYLGDQSVTWLSTGNLDAVNATGSSYIFDPVTASTTGQIIAQSGEINDFTGVINVQVGVLQHIFVTSSPGGQPIGNETIISGQSRTYYASGYDADNNYISLVSVDWSSTGTLDAVNATGTSYTFTPINAPTSGTIVATSGEMDDATGTITVEEGDISYIVIMDVPDGGGSEITSLGLTSDESLTAYAASYDANNNYLGDISVIWSTTGTLDFVQTTGSSFTFNPVTAPTSGTITATSGYFNDATGTISVSVGALSEIRINDATGAAGEEIYDVSMMTDETLTLYSSGYDSDGNFVAMYDAGWSSTGTLDAVSGTGTSYTFDPITASTSGTIVATYDDIPPDATGTISVNQGAAHHIIITDSPNGTEIGPLDLVVGQSVTLYASSYDQYDNYISLVSANWSTTGNLDNQSNVGTSFTFTPVTAPTSGSIIANSGLLDSDNTGIINVDLGSLASIVIRTAPGGTGVEFENYNMTADDSITLWAAAYDVGDNYLGDTLAVWSSTGTLDPVSGSAVSYNFNPVSAPTSGTITATALGRNDQTGTITVTHGAAVSLVDADDLGNERTTIAGITQLLRVRVLDQHGNNVSGQTVSFAPAARMSVANATSNAIGIVETYYTTPQSESSSIAEASSTGLDPLFFTVYGIRYVSHSLEPKVVSRGNNIAFTIQVSNPGNVSVPINLSSSHITFSDGQGHSYSASFASPDILPADTSIITIQCIAAMIDADFQGGSYTPEIWIVGRDDFSGMNGRLLTDPDELTIGTSDITVGLVQVPDVLQGDVGITANFSVLNTGIPLSIDPFPMTRIDFRQNGTSYPVDNLQRLDTLSVLQTGIPNEFEFQFDIPPDYPVGNIDVYVRLSLDNGYVVVTPTEPSGTFQVLSGGNAVYVSNSLNPGNVVPRQSVNFQADFQNTGLADIVLNPTQTYMEIIGSGIAPVNLVGSFSLLNQQTTRISFEEVSIPSDLPIGTYDVSWRIYGTMLNGTQIYNDTIDVREALTVQAPARLVFSNINIPDDIVRQGQSDVEIEYTVINSGDSDARVSSITNRFRTIDGVTIPSTNWIATSIQPSLPNNISAGSSQTYSIFYTILSNAQTELIRPAPIINYQDIRTPSINDTSQTILNNDMVEVIEPAKIRIEDLTILADTLAPNAPNVNIDQPFHLRVTINNTGLDFIESAKVRLFVNSNPVPLDSIIFLDISSGTVQTHEFTQSRSTNGTVTYKVLISEGEALDAIGNPAQIEQPGDNVENVTVQKPSLLNLNMVIYKSEEVLDSLIVSESQIFNVRVNIENQGQSPYGNGEIVIKLPEDHFTWLDPQQPDSMKIFTSENSFVEWQIQATQPSNSGIYEVISTEVKQAPTDLNTNDMVLYTIADNAVHVSIEPIGEITNNTLSIYYPEGSLDGIISTDQTFTLHSEISFNSTISPSGRHVKINLPGEFIIVGETERNLPGDNNEPVEEWIIKAPEEATYFRSITVTCSGIDKNSELVVDKTSLPVSIRTVEKAKLDLSLQIVKNQGAEDDTLSVGQQFKLQAQVDNQGTAVVSGEGKVYIEDLALNPNINMDNPSTFNDTLSFTAGTPISWNLVVDQVPPEVIASLLISLDNAINNRKEIQSTISNDPFNESITPRKIFNEIFELTSQADIRSTELVVRFKELPDDDNTNQPADTVSSSVSKSIFIEEQASLSFANITIPDTVTTGQKFNLKVEATPSPNLINPKARILLPNGFQETIITVDMNAQYIADIEIQVPTDPSLLSPSAVFRIMISGTDDNSYQQLPWSVPEEREINILIKPELAMNYEIIRPRSAVTNNMLSYGQTVEINVWADTLPQTSQLKYADIKDNGSIVLNQNVFDQGKFTKIENESYEKEFTSYKQKLNFKLRAPQENITTSVNFSFNQLPKDKFSNALVDIDIEEGSIKIPISVSAKEITVTKIDSLIKNTNFTRGLDGNIIFAFKISNEGYLDNLYANSLELLFSAKNDTSRLTDLALANMLETIQVVNYEQYESAMGKQTLSDPKTYATFAVDENESTNPIKIDFNQIVILPPDSVDILMVVAKFAAKAVTRSFWTKLTGINAYDDDPDFPVVIVDEQGGHIGESDYFSSDVFNIMTDNLKEAFVVYPNPFVQSERPRATIKFLLKEQSDVSIRIYTLLGELVRSKWDRNLKGLHPGTYDGEVFWDGTNDRGNKVLNGVYLCTIEIHNASSTKRFITKIGYIK